MAKRICEVVGCNGKHEAKGCCSKHYSKLRKYGTPYGGRNYESHGMKNTPEYIAWASMIRRCYNPNIKDFKYWGGKGITVCDRWKNSFLAFCEDMGDKPFKNAHLDRINGCGNYEPSNCRWVTQTQNNRNKKDVKLNMAKILVIRTLIKNGNLKIKEIAQQYGVHADTIRLIRRNKIWKEGV